MQFLLLRRGILPGEYYALPEGEKVLIRVFFEDYVKAKSER
jgi:hypothetical protein